MSCPKMPGAALARDPGWFATGAYSQTMEELEAKVNQQELGRRMTAATGSSGEAQAPTAAAPQQQQPMPAVKQSTITADDVTVFFRHAGPDASVAAPVVVLLHGFPSSSFMFRHLIPPLAQAGYRVFAPDLPGFGLTDVPPGRGYEYTYESLSRTFEAFCDRLGLRRFALYVSDLGAPVGLRFALRRPDAVAALVTQAGNAYVEGLARPFWAPFEAYWAARGAQAAGQRREALRATFAPAVTRWRYTHGRPALAARVAAERPWDVDQALLDRPGAHDRHLDLFRDHAANVALYPAFQSWLACSLVPVLAVWGRHDPISHPAGAVAYARHVRDMEIRWVDAGHFALEGNEPDVAAAMCDFFDSYYVFCPLV